MLKEVLTACLFYQSSGDATSGVLGESIEEVLSNVGQNVAQVVK